MDLLVGLEQRAAAAGGRVDVLLGNHEAMNLIGEVRDVTPTIYTTFADDRSAERREAAYQGYVKLCRAQASKFSIPPPVYRLKPREDWMATHPPGFVEYRAPRSAPMACTGDGCGQRRRSCRSATRRSCTRD